jgi:hypothetical protein
MRISIKNVYDWQNKNNDGECVQMVKRNIHNDCKLHVYYTFH